MSTVLIDKLIKANIEKSSGLDPYLKWEFIKSNIKEEKETCLHSVLYLCEKGSIER